MPVQQYTKKPVTIEAIQLTPASFNACCDFLGEENYRFGARDDDIVRIEIKTLEGITVALSGWYIIKGVKGEFYACEPEIFEMTYSNASNGLDCVTGFVVVDCGVGGYQQPVKIGKLFNAKGNANALRNRKNDAYQYIRSIPRIYKTLEFNIPLSQMKEVD